MFGCHSTSSSSASDESLFDSSGSRPWTFNQIRCAKLLAAFFRLIARLSCSSIYNGSASIWLSDFPPIFTVMAAWFFPCLCFLLFYITSFIVIYSFLVLGKGISFFAIRMPDIDFEWIPGFDCYRVGIFSTVEGANFWYDGITLCEVYRGMFIYCFLCLFSMETYRYHVLPRFCVQWLGGLRSLALRRC